MKRIALAGLLIVGAALVNANGAEAAGGSAWKLQSTRAAGLPSDSDFRGVACATSTMCIGVGGRAESPGFAFAERWDGKRWKLLSVSQPAGATWSTFSGVSCSSSSACTAVGSYIDGSGNVLTLAERWNGKSWVMQTTPSPGSYGPSLFGVSCSTGSDCAAVGAYQAVSGGPEVTLAEHWNGHTWTVQSTQNPTGAGRWSQLSEVSCSSPNACTAVGTFFELVEPGAHGGGTLEWDEMGAAEPRCSGGLQPGVAVRRVVCLGFSLYRRWDGNIQHPVAHAGGTVGWPRVGHPVDTEWSIR